MAHPGQPVLHAYESKVRTVSELHGKAAYASSFACVSRSSQQGINQSIELQEHLRMPKAGHSRRSSTSKILSTGNGAEVPAVMTTYQL